jgi:hypothetical protein
VSRFFYFRGGWHLHNVQSLTSCILMEDPAIHFANSSPEVFLVILLNALLLRSCCLRPRSLMTLLHSGPFQHLFRNVHPFRVLGATSSLFCLLRHATPAWWAILLRAAANSFQHPSLPWVNSFG